MSTPRFLLVCPLSLVATALLGCSGATDGAKGVSPSFDSAVAETAIEDSRSATDAPSGDSVDATDTDAAPPRSAGCGRVVKPGVTDVTIDVGGTSRSYALSIPAGYDPNRPYPLVFGWHGRLGNGPAFRAYSGVETEAANAAVFVYPNGLPITVNPADTGWILTLDGRDVAFFDALLAEQSKNLCIDGKRVFSYGHSFGAYMSNVLGCRRAKVVRAIAAFAGGPPSGTCDGPMAAWIAHAKDDTVVLVSEGNATRDKWGGTNGCDLAKSAPVTPAPCVAFQGCGASTPLHWCNPTLGNHNWPGFAAQGIWQFFADR